MRVGFVQINCEFGNKENNLKKVENLIKDRSADLWVLPELFNTGYVFASKKELATLAEPIPDGRTTQSLIKLAQLHQTTIVAGIAEVSNGDLYNSAICVSNSGLLGKYRKIHLFDREKFLFKRGGLPYPVLDLGNYKLGLMICFDWIFPEAARSLALKGADILCHPSNLVLPYCQDAMVTRCLENRVFAITANRIGGEKRADVELVFTGMSEIVSPGGKILAKASKDREEAMVVEIDVLQARDKYITPNNNIFEDRKKELYFL